MKPPMLPNIYECYFDKECTDLPIDFDEDAQGKVRSTSFYHETEREGVLNDSQVEGSTGAGIFQEKPPQESFFYYNSTVEVNTTMVGDPTQRRVSRYTEFFNAIDKVPNIEKLEPEETKAVNRRGYVF